MLIARGFFDHGGQARGSHAFTGTANCVTPPGQAANRERVLLLECRLEQMRSALRVAREEADRARSKLAEATAREANHARRYSLLHEELADARAEVALLHRQLERSEVLRAEMEGHLFESGAHGDAEELVRLRRKALAEGQRTLVSSRALARLRSRVEELLASRETLLTRVAEWQRMVREDGPEAADLSEFMAELRSEILELERRQVASEAREAVLRERLALAGLDPELQAEALEAEASEGGEADGDPGVDDPAHVESVLPRTLEARETSHWEAPAVTAESAPGDEGGDTHGPDPLDGPGPAEALIAELVATDEPALRCELLLRLGRTGDGDALEAIRPWTGSTEPAVRAAAYEGLGRLLDRNPAALEPHLRKGLSDGDARVRRRVVLAAATARGVALWALLNGLRDDPDRQVRRVVREVLRQTPPAAEAAERAAESDAPQEADPPDSNRSLRAL